MLSVDCAAAAQFLKTHVPSLSQLGDLAAILVALLRDRQIRGGIIEIENLPAQWRVAAIGISGFVADSVRDNILSAAHGGLADQFLSGIDQSLLNDRAQALQAPDGLNLVVIAFVPDMNGIAQPILNVALARSLEHFIATHRGFHIKSMLREDPEDFLPFVLQTGLKQLRQCKQSNGQPQMHLLGFLPEDRLTAKPGSVADMLIHFDRPRLGCSVAECRVLDLAYAGLTDAQIADELDISPNTLKQNWRSILDRARQMLGRPAHNDKQTTTKPSRGMEFRSQVLLHLRDNPQDMRPWDFRTK